jgi:hypothetical protein
MAYSPSVPHIPIPMSKTQAHFKVGQPVTYEIWDGEEGRSYGWFMNRKTAKITSVFYKMDNFDSIEASNLTLVSSSQASIPDTSGTNIGVFCIGDKVTYTILDGEEGRSYGWFMNTKTAKITSIFYKMDNFDKIEQDKNKLAPVLLTESKSEALKTVQNGPPS